MPHSSLPPSLCVCEQKLASSGSYLDGGANHPLQRHALPMLDIDFILKDTLALQTHFR